jgi:ATP-binding cassette subfamily B protein RaxB
MLQLYGRRTTPVIVQSEASECGLACLAMVAGHHGLDCDLPALRRQFSMSLKGSTLKTLMGVAEKLGFHSRAVRAELDNLDQLRLPSIIHWNLNHFVVLTRIRRGVRGITFEVHDPAVGRRTLKASEFSQQFTGVALELTKSQSFSPGRQTSRLKISQLWSRLEGLGSSLATILALSVILQIASLAGPFYIQIAVDSALPAFDSDLLSMLAFGFGGLALVTLVTSWLRAMLLASLGNAFSYQLVVNLYRHLLRLPLPWFEKRHVGDIISRFSSTQPIADLLAQGLIAAVIDGVMAVLTLVLMYIYSPKLASIALVAWLAFAGLRIASYQTVRFRNVNVIAAAARENSSFIESVRGIAAVKAFGQEANRQRTWQQLKANSINANIKLARITGSFDAIGQFVILIERVVFVYVAVGLAMGGTFTVGMIFAFQAYKQQFLDASTRLVEFGIKYRLLDVHLERIADIALARPETLNGLVSLDDHRPRGAIELRSVSFRYGFGEPDVLQNVNLRVEPGELITLVGPSGGGKTTLLKIMMGLLEPTHGQLLIDGEPLTSFGVERWRRAIGSVAQDDILYAGSLAENIAFFDAEIDMDRVKAVARQAAIHDTIERMPMRYETLVGDMGSALSGGQKQRVLLARALYAQPAALFMDEGTAHLDPEAERQVMASLAAVDMTRVISAHRPGGIAQSARTVLVANGQARTIEVARPAPPAAANA